MNIDDLIDARLRRRDLWAAACSGQITTDELYAGLLDLRARFGSALYDRPGR